MLEQKFEIQIRTALQHAWAEIEHKQQYKSTASLPPSLNRRLMLLAGTLESLDAQFSAIVHDAANYKELVRVDTKSVQDDQLSAQALMALFDQLIEKNELDSEVFVVEEIPFSDEIIARLNGLGIDTVAKLKEQLFRISKHTYFEFGVAVERVNTTRIFSFLMIFSFSETYMKLCVDRNVNWIDGRVLNFFDTNHPNLGVREFVTTFGLEIR